MLMAHEILMRIASGMVFLNSCCFTPLFSSSYPLVYVADLYSIYVLINVVATNAMNFSLTVFVEL